MISTTFVIEDDTPPPKVVVHEYGPGVKPLVRVDINGSDLTVIASTPEQLQTYADAFGQAASDLRMKLRAETGAA